MMSTDGDCIVLGAEKLYFNVNFNTETFQIYEKSVDILCVEKNPLFKYKSKNWPLIASLLGNDYVKRIPNVGFATIFNKILPNLVHWDADEVMIVQNNNAIHKMSYQHKIALEKSINLITHAPVLNENNELKPMHQMGPNPC